MNFLFTVDHKFVKPLCVLLRSIKKNTSKRDRNVFYIPCISNDPFTKKEQALIKKQIKKIDIIHFLELPDDAVVYAHDRKRWGYQIWIKLTCLYFLPNSINKLLFIDSDCVINGDITSFYNKNNSSIPFIGIKEDNDKALARLNLPQDGNYLCAAFLLINPIEIRKKIPSLQELKAMITSFPYQYDCDEQDFFSYHFQDSLIAVNDRRYNFFVLWTENSPKEDIIVYHYAGSPKPWVDYRKKYSFHNFNIYWKYAIPVFGLTKYLKMLLRAFIVVIKKKIK